MTKEKGFVWYNNPGAVGDNNDGELNDWLEKGWKIFGFSDPVVVDGRATVFVNLVKPEDEDEEDDDSEIE